MQDNFVLKFHPTFSAHYHPHFPNCHLITFPPLRPCHITILPPCHLTSPRHLLHLVIPLHSPTFPTFPAHYSPNFPSSPPSQRQGKHVWLIVRQPLIKASWWDAPVVLRDLAKAISRTYKILYHHQEGWDEKTSFERALRALMRPFHRELVGFNNI